MNGKFKKLLSIVWFIAAGFICKNLHAAEKTPESLVTQSSKQGGTTSGINPQDIDKNMLSMIQTIMEKMPQGPVKQLPTTTQSSNDKSDPNALIEQMKRTIMLKELEAKSKMLDLELEMAQKIAKKDTKKSDEKEKNPTNSVTRENFLKIVVIAAIIYSAAYPVPVLRRTVHAVLGLSYKALAKLVRFCLQDPWAQVKEVSVDKVSTMCPPCPTMCETPLQDVLPVAVKRSWGSLGLSFLKSKFMPPIVVGLGAGLFYAGKKVYSSDYVAPIAIGAGIVASLYIYQAVGFWAVGG